MATSFAPMTNSAPRFPLDLPIPLHLTALPAVEVVVSPASTLPVRELEFDMQSLLDKFMPGKTRRTYLA